MKDCNSKEELMRWMEKALDTSDGLTEEGINGLAAAGKQVIDDGGWRGNVSEAWKMMGYGPADINDMYL